MQLPMLDSTVLLLHQLIILSPLPTTQMCSLCPGDLSLMRQRSDWIHFALGLAQRKSERSTRGLRRRTSQTDFQSSRTS